MYAPIALFVYNRCDHVKQTLEALSKNSIASECELYIFSDGAKSEQGAPRVEEVRAFINQPIWQEKFQAVHIVASEQNKGLVKSIISGVSQLMEQYGRAIILEDDCVTSPDFLEYMNSGLEFFKDDSSVGAICGYTALKTFPENYPHDIFTVRRFSSCAWASWKNVWELVDWEVKDYKDFCTNWKDRREFNRYGQDLCGVLDYQMSGKGTSWAIRFDYMLFRNRLRSIYPCKTRVKNVGFDEGTHVSAPNHGTDKFVVEIESNLTLPNMEEIREYPEIRKEFVSFYKKSWYRRLIRYVRDVLPRLAKIKKGVK